MEEDKIYLNQGKKKDNKHEDLYMEQYTGNDWGEKASFTVGVSYVVASVLGMGKGGIEGFRQVKPSMPKKLMLNTIFNQLGKVQSSWGQAAAAASLMYYLTGSTLNLFFEDELHGLSNLQKNIICGSISGALYKSTLGVTPMAVGTLLGGGLIGGLTMFCDVLNRQGYIGFEMKF